MQIEVITKQDLQVMEKKILDAVNGLAKANNTDEHWLRSKEARQLLKCSSSTLQNLRVKGVLPFTKLGGSTYYDKKDIFKLMEKNKKNSG
jgi:hypothetical protein